MPITSNLINIAKGLGRSSTMQNKLQKAARSEVYEQLKSSLKSIKTDAFGKMEGYTAIQDAENTAEQAMRNVRPPMAPAVYDEAETNFKNAQQAVLDFEKAHEAQARQDVDLVALSRLKIKEKLGSQATGNEYARIRSVGQLGEKHPVIKVNLPVRGKEQSVGDYVKDAHEKAKKFIDALNERSPFVSPRLAAQGKDINASVSQYKEALDAFKLGDEGAPTIPEMLAEQSVATKLLKDGRFRTQIRSLPHVGKLTDKTKWDQNEHKTLREHVYAGITKAAGLAKAIQEDAATPFVSHNLLRNNFVQKRLSDKGLERFSQAKESLNAEIRAENNRISSLAEQGILVKILRDGAFRITRLNEEGVVAQTKTIPLTKDMKMEHQISNGFHQAKELAKEALPEKISTRQKLSNKFRPLKRALLNFIG